MERLELHEATRRNLIKTDIEVLDLIVTIHNLINCISHKQWDRLNKQTASVLHSCNRLVEKLNTKPTPVEDEIIELENKIKKLNSY